MDLKAIIAAKKAATETIVASNLDDDLFFLTPPKEEPIKTDVSLVETGSYEPPSPAHFLAAWTPFLLFPYALTTQVRRDYIKWFLSPQLYVLNSFKRIDSHRIFEVFMSYCPPSSIRESYLLSQLCWDIDLSVPQQYEDQFVEIIKRKFHLTKNPDSAIIIP